MADTHGMEARRWRNLAISLLVSGGFLYLVFRNVQLNDLGTALRRVDSGWLLVSVGLSLLIMIFRAWRWQLELRPLEHVPLGRLWVVTTYRKFKQPFFLIGAISPARRGVNRLSG